MDDKTTPQPSALAKIPFDDKLANFTELTTKRATLNKLYKEANNSITELRRKFSVGEGSVVRVVKEYEPTADKDIQKIISEFQAVEWLAGIVNYPSGLNAILAKKFPDLIAFAKQVVDEHISKTVGIVDEDATAMVKQDLEKLLAERTKIKNELDEVVELIDNVKEFIDVADKVSNIGARIKAE